MSAAAAHHDAPDRSSANQAGEAGTEIYPVFKLEEAFDPGGIHIVGNGGSAQRNCLPQDALQAGMQAVDHPPIFGRAVRRKLGRLVMHRFDTELSSRVWPGIVHSV